MKNNLLIEIGFEDYYLIENLDFKKLKDSLNYDLSKFSNERLDINISYSYRRVVIFIKNICTEIKTEQKKIAGPNKNIIFNNNTLTKAGESFCKSKNIKINELEIIEDKIFYRNPVKIISLEKELNGILFESFKKITIGIQLLKWKDNSVNPFFRRVKWVLVKHEKKTFNINFYNKESSNFTVVNKYKKIEIDSVKEYFEALNSNNIFLVNFEKKNDFFKLHSHKFEKFNLNIKTIELIKIYPFHLMENFFIFQASFCKKYNELPINFIKKLIKEQKCFFLEDNKFLIISSVNSNNSVKGFEILMNSKLKDLLEFYKKDLSKRFS